MWVLNYGNLLIGCKDEAQARRTKSMVNVENVKISRVAKVGKRLMVRMEFL